MFTSKTLEMLYEDLCKVSGLRVRFVEHAHTDRAVNVASPPDNVCVLIEMASACRCTHYWPYKICLADVASACRCRKVPPVLETFLLKPLFLLRMTGG